MKTKSFITFPTSIKSSVPLKLFPYFPKNTLLTKMIPREFPPCLRCYTPAQNTLLIFATTNYTSLTNTSIVLTYDPLFHHHLAPKFRHYHPTFYHRQVASPKVFSLMFWESSHESQGSTLNLTYAFYIHKGH